jgi:hypothetical protein
MTHDDPVEQLTRALAITPSPEFAARVRQEIAARPSHVAWWSAPHMLLAAAGVCAVIVVPAVMLWPGGVSAPVVRPDVTVASSEHVAVVVSGVATAQAPSGVATRPAVPRRQAPLRPVRVESVFGETLVPDDQRLALERLLGGIRAGRATVPGVVAEETVDEDGRRLPSALVIEPLKLELLAGTPAEPNKDPIRESVK